MNKIKGNDVVLVIVEPGPVLAKILCLRSCTITRTWEVIPTTTISSGLAREFRTRRYEWGLSVEGLVVINPDLADDKTIFDFLLEGGKKDIELSFTDPDGADKYLTGSVIFPEMSIAANVDDWANFSMELKGTGPLSIS